MYKVIADNGTEILVPDVGETATTEQLIAICEAFGMEYEAEILRTDQPPVPFLYNGCSGPAPEEVDGVDIRLACLLHDISYYLGYPEDDGADERRAAADYLLGMRMLQLGVRSVSTDLYVGGVRAGGSWWPGSEWGYGRKYAKATS